MIRWDSPPRSGHGTHRPGSEFEELFGILFLVVAGAVAWILATGHLAALIFDGSWPAYELRQVPAVLGDVFEDLDDPGRAWDPVTTAGRPPGPLAFWTVGALLVAVPLGVWMWSGRRRSPAHHVEGEHWATGRDLAKLRIRRPGERVVVGRVRTSLGRSVLLGLEDRHSLVVFGATQSGKSSGLAIPTLLEWSGPIVCTSVKNDLVAATAGHRAEMGRVQVFDPAGVTNHVRSTWTPMARSHTWEGAIEDANKLAAAAQGSQTTSFAMHGYWYNSAAKLLGPFLHAAARTGRSITEVARWIDRQERGEVIVLLGGHIDATAALDAIFNRSETNTSDTFGIAQSILSIYLNPIVAASAASCDIDPAGFFDGHPNTLYLTAPEGDMRKYASVFSTLIGDMMDAAHQHVGSTGQPFSPGLLLLPDEAANIAPLENLDALVSTSAGYGINHLTIFQDLSQANVRFGEAASTIVSNHRGTLILPALRISAGFDERE